MANEVRGDSTKTGVPAVDGTHTGVAGAAGVGVRGTSDVGRGVVGSSTSDYGMRAHSDDATGMRASSTNGRGVEGEARSSREGVFGTSQSGTGVHGDSTTGAGVLGAGHGSFGAGVVGLNDSAAPAASGGWFRSTNGEGVHAETHSSKTAALAVYQTNADSDSAALYAKHQGGRNAAVFAGNVVLTGHIEFTNAADCAEEFDLSTGAAAEPGTVMVLDDDSAVRGSWRPYDRRVAGVVSGAGSYRAGLLLDRRGCGERAAVALVGKVFCKVDASPGPIAVGDLLTTSALPGHAMRADDPGRSFGAVLGKALRPLGEGQGLIPILIALQ